MPRQWGENLLKAENLTPLLMLQTSMKALNRSLFI